MTLSFIPRVSAGRQPRIIVIGVGDAGHNAINTMTASQFAGIDFIFADTASWGLPRSHDNGQLQRGEAPMQGEPIGPEPTVSGTTAAYSADDVVRLLIGCDMVFFIAWMESSGVGAAAMIARAAHDRAILTVGVLTSPCHREDLHSVRATEADIEDLTQSVDSLIILPSCPPPGMRGAATAVTAPGSMADNAPQKAVQAITNLLLMPCMASLGVDDIRCVLGGMGKAMVGHGEAEGDQRAIRAAEAAIGSVLGAGSATMANARGLLINVAGGTDMTLEDIDEAANRIRDEACGDIDIIFGTTFDEGLNGKLRVSVVVTGIGPGRGATHGETLILP